MKLDYIIMKEMKQSSAGLFAAIGFIFLATAAGFYFVLDKLNRLEDQGENLQAQIQLMSGNEPVPPTVALPAEKQDVTEKPPTVPAGLVIPASIIFSVKSSPLLSPQTNLTITVESVALADDGTITVNIKVFSNEAVSYSALEPRDIFQLVNLEDANQSPLSVNGQFNSIPPQNAVTGSLTFKTTPDNKTIILQIGAGDQIKYYEFDFRKQNYKETILG